MNAPIALKYLRTTKGCVVFPCLAAGVGDVAAAISYPKVSEGIVVWDYNDLPLCLEPKGQGHRIDDTNALRAEWGLPAYEEAPVLDEAALAAAQRFGSALDGASLEQPSEVL